MCVCVRARARARVYVCVRAHTHALVCVCVCVCMYVTAENMVKLLTGCRVFEMDLENMLWRVMEKRGEPGAYERAYSKRKKEGN